MNDINEIKNLKSEIKTGNMNLNQIKYKHINVTEVE